MTTVFIAVLTMLVAPLLVSSESDSTSVTSEPAGLTPPPSPFPVSEVPEGYSWSEPSDGIRVSGSGVLLVIIAAFTLWFVCMLRVLTKADNYRNATQLIWILVLLLSGPVGAVLFLLVGAGTKDVDKPLRSRAESAR